MVIRVDRLPAYGNVLVVNQAQLPAARYRPWPVPSYNDAFPGEVGKISDSLSQGIFLSYRREDSAPHASSLQLQLRQRFPDARVFMDLDSIEPGLDFAEIIEQAVSSCAVLVALIGRQWVTLTDEHGDRRLDNPDDLVRFEVQAALQRGIRLIPVLVDGAKPLRQQDLPAELYKLARLNAHTLSYLRYKDDTDQLVDLIQRVLAAVSAREEAERKTREEAEQQAREDAERQAQAAAARQPREEAEPRAREEAKPQATAAADRQPREKAERQATAAAEPRARKKATRRIGTLIGHTGTVRGVAFSPDGRLLASGGDMTVRLWDPVSGECRRILTGSGTVRGVAFSPDGRLLASGGSDGTVQLWDPVSGDRRGTLTGHGQQVNCLAFSPDGRLLASGGDDKTVRLWDPVSGKHLRTLKRAYESSTFLEAGVLSVAFSPDGRLLASGRGDSTVTLWDPTSNTSDRTLVSLRDSDRTLVSHRDYVNAVAFSPDGQPLASGSSDTTVRLWDPVSGHLRRILTGHTGTVRGVAFSPDGRLLASGDDKTLQLWDPATGRHRRTLIRDTSIECVAFSPDGRLLASGGDKTVRLFDLGGAKTRA